MHSHTGSITQTSDRDRQGRTASGKPRLALVVAWLDGAPERVGEVLHVRGTAVFGRGGPRPSDPHPRVGLYRVRPGSETPQPPMQARWLSRVQLELQGDGESLSVWNRGRAELRVDGRVVDEARLTEGQVLELGGQLVLLVARLPDAMGSLEPAVPLHGFGEADPLGIVGESPAAWELRRAIHFAAPRSAHVLVQGESGTGKELVGRALHRLSPRSQGAFVSRNAATVPEGLFDAELFGHAANYPQAGMPAREGLVGAADGGSLFLDEFAELPAAMQPHLLRVLDDGEYQRLGETASRTVDLRLLAATNQPDEALRADLLARFALRVRVPPMGERRSDVPLLFRHLLAQILAGEPDLSARFVGEAGPRVSPGLVRAALQLDYSTHVRQLRALIWRALAASPGDVVELHGEPEVAAPWAMWRGADPLEIPGEVVQACLDAHNGSQTETFQALGLSSRHVLARLVRRHELVVRKQA